MIGRSREAFRRLGEFLAPFEGCFLRRKQRGAVMRYVDGLIGPSERKNFQQMWASLEDPGDYQALHHGIALAEPKSLVNIAGDDLGSRGPSHRGRYGDSEAGVVLGGCSAPVFGNDGEDRKLLDLYLPEAWTEDPERRAKGEIPEGLSFRTK